MSLNDLLKLIKQTRKTEGSGIGLSLVKSLIEMHEGTIRLKSKLGEGSEFIITLPVREVVEETPKPKEALLQDIQKENNKNIQLEFSDIYAD